MSVTRFDVLRLYRLLLRESMKFPSYNIRMYALRRIRSHFQENKNETEVPKIENFYKEGLKNLETIKRQVVIGNLYDTEKLVIES